MGRYEAIEGSQLGHGCCFSATVVDLTKPTLIGGEHYNNEYDVVCECCEMDDAIAIAAVLNAKSPPPPK